MEHFLRTHVFLSGVGLSPLGTAATYGLLYKPQMIDEGGCGAIDGMKIDRGNRSTRRKPALAPFCPPQIPHDQTRVRTEHMLLLHYFVFHQRLCNMSILRSRENIRHII
jgi:hypothetical protein